MENYQLEDYAQVLGAYAGVLFTLWGHQNKAIESGFLTNDEIENAKTVCHCVDRLMTTLNDQCRLIGARTPGGWKEVVRKCVEKFNKDTIGEEKNG